MRLQGLTYPIGAILLVLLFALNTVEGGYRLPRYYTPDGILIPLGKQQSNSRARVLYEIDGRSPAASPALFDEPGRVVVVTDLGVGLMPLVPNNTWQVLFDFKLPILFTFIWLFGGIWFFSSTRDLHLTAFALRHRSAAVCQLFWRHNNHPGAVSRREKGHGGHPEILDG